MPARLPVSLMRHLISGVGRVNARSTVLISIVQITVHAGSP